MDKYKKVSELTKQERLDVKEIYSERLHTDWEVVYCSRESELFPLYYKDGKFDYGKVDFTEYPELALEALEDLKNYHYGEIDKLNIITTNVWYSLDEYVLEGLNISLGAYLELKELE